ncbi:MAG: hypothetical protein HFACDABA_01153 [Anaerolineales bacterium]|nr:hypothetical protein [Anaerolineales bacterium]
MKTDRPWAVTGMRFTVLTLAVWNMLRLGATLANWSTLAEFVPRPGPLYIAITASFWTLVCFAVANAIRRRNPRAQTLYALILIGYTAWWWMDRRFLSDMAQTNWLFTVVITAIVMLDVTATFFDKNLTAYFTQRERYDQQPPHQQTS